jgi:1-acyl-sn-glycerol-3-phosphate acyltransferase
MTVGRAIGLAGAVTRLVVEAEIEREATALDLGLRAMRTARTILSVHGVDVRTEGPPPRGACVVVANHLSYIDPLVVSAVAPCISVAKGETRAWPLIGRGLKALGVIFVQRGDPYSGAVAIRQAWRALRFGATVLNFPEGTTSDGRDVGAFRRGVFGLALLAGVPIVPARITYSDDRVPWTGGQTFAPHYWRLAGVSRLEARVRFGEAMRPGRVERAADVAELARAAVAAL